jgi:hypothetical protein
VSSNKRDRLDLARIHIVSCVAVLPAPSGALANDDNLGPNSIEDLNNSGDIGRLLLSAWFELRSPALRRALAVGRSAMCVHVPLARARVRRPGAGRRRRPARSRSHRSPRRCGGLRRVVHPCPCVSCSWDWARGPARQRARPTNSDLARLRSHRQAGWRRHPCPANDPSATSACRLPCRHRRRHAALPCRGRPPQSHLMPQYP